MKTGWIIAIVVAVHCVAVGSLIVIQGCGTTSKAPAVAPPSDTVKMPESVTEPKPVVKPVEKPLVVPPSVKTTVYTVEPGDSLSTIAHRFHLRAADIQELNKIKDPKKIRVGQKLILPGEMDVMAFPKPKKSPAKPKTEVSTPPAQGQGDTHVVQAGDTLSGIASKYGTTADAIRVANGLTGKTLNIGRKLVIPAGAPKKESLQQKTPEVSAKPVQKEAAPVTSTTAPVTTATTAPAQTVPQVNLDTKPVSKLSTPPPAVGAPAARPVANANKTSDAGKAPTVITHTVADGEDLKTVAMTYGVSEEEIKKFNGLTDTTLKSGQTLKIPMAE
jgi:LysM repeat protein